MEHYKERHEKEEVNPKVWVGSLADYNNGNLFGKWMDANCQPKELMEEISGMLRNSRQPYAEEWAIFDYDEFYGVNLGEYEDLEKVTAIARGLAEHGRAFGYFASAVDCDRDKFPLFEESYVGHFDSYREYGRQVIEEFDYEKVIDELPFPLAPYITIDEEMFARDMELNDMIVTAEGDGGLYVFMVVW